MKAFTTDAPEEIRSCLKQLRDTDGGTGFMHESFNSENAADFTRSWFAWTNTLFGELILLNFPSLKENCCCAKTTAGTQPDNTNKKIINFFMIL